MKKKMMLRVVLLTALAAVMLAACGPDQAVIDAQVANSVNATVAAIPPQVQTVEVPVNQEVPVTVEVPVNVEVPVTVVVTATPDPNAAAAGSGGAAPTEAPASDSAAAATPTTAAAAQVNTADYVDPLAGASSAPLFQEDFLIPDYWDEFSNDFGEGAIVSETYSLTNYLTERLVWVFNGRRGANFYYEVEAELTTVCKERDNYGIAFRVVDSNNFYAFGVSCEGRYRLLRQLNGAFDVLLDWTPSDAVEKFEATNVLGVRAEGNQLHLYVNGVYLTTVIDDTFDAGRFGFYIGSRLTPNLNVIYDDAIAYPIP